MDINFELYKIFYHAAKYESFTEAAERLHITQSAVSQSMKNLEEKTGSRLFYRKGRHVTLTGEGELLFRHIEQAYNFIKTAEGKILEMQNMEAGEIRIGTGDTICKYFLLPHLEKFTRQYPKIRIQVLNRTSSQILDILKKGVIDFGIITLPADEKDIIAENFTAVEDIFVASGRFGQLKGRKIPLRELVRYPLLLLEKSSATRRNLDSLLKEEGIAVSPEIELESVDLLVEFARIGLGIAHVLKESAASAIAGGELFEVETAEPLPLRRLGVAFMQNVPLSRASVEFIRSLKQQGFQNA